jgi:hypothetical protein
MAFWPERSHRFSQTKNAHHSLPKEISSVDNEKIEIEFGYDYDLREDM